MKQCILIGSIFLALTGWAMAHTGGSGGEPAYEEFDFTTLDPLSHVEDETVNNPNNAFKGWWYVNLTNSTAQSWSKVTITPGVGDLVAIVQGTGLEDDWGFMGDSIVANKPGSMVYSTVRGSGSRLYDNGATGLLWGQAEFTLATPLASGQKLGLKIYTDNSWYEGPYATSYQMTITPVAVPEPATLSVLALGALGLLRRRSR